MCRSIAFLASIITLFLPAVESNPFLISDDRVRSLDIAPTLGRGYSIMTNTYQSTCLVVDGTTVPSFNYDCKYNSLWMPFINNIDLSLHRDAHSYNYLF